MNTFNWRRAAEGAITAALIAGASAYQAVSANHEATTAAVLSTTLVAFLVAFIKGIGQSVQDASVVVTQTTQPVNSTSLSETTVTTNSPQGESHA